MKKKITIGILAHVDAGKTTLSEALLYISGKIRKLGRVDHGKRTPRKRIAPRRAIAAIPTAARIGRRDLGTRTAPLTAAMRPAAKQRENVFVGFHRKSLLRCSGLSPTYRI